MDKNNLIIVRTVLKNAVYQIENTISYMDDNIINDFYDKDKVVSDKNIDLLKDRYFKLCKLYDKVCKLTEGD